MYISDMYADVMVAVQMWQHKSFLPENWVFGNQIYLCATPAIASILYGITGAPFLAMGMASCLMVLAQLLCLDYLCRAVFPGWWERLLCLVLYLGLPAMTGNVVRQDTSWQLLFTMCSYYGCYAATAFLCFGVWLRGGKHVPILTAILACLLSFATGLQSVRQTLIMTMPLAVAEILCRLASHGSSCAARANHAVFLCASNLLGLLCRRFLHYPRREIFGSYGLLSPTEMVESAKNSVLTMLNLLFPGFPLWLSLLLMAAAVAYFLWVIYRNLANFHGNSQNLLLLVLALSVSAVFAADVLTKIEVRNVYYFMLYPFLSVLLVSFLRQLRGGFSVFSFLIVIALLLNAGFQNVLPACRQVWHRMDDPEWAVSRELVCSGYTTVFSHWNGCETLAAASNGALQAGFWSTDDAPFDTPITWLCDPSIFSVPAEESVFVFYGEAERDLSLAELAKQGVSARLLGQYFNERHYSEAYLYELGTNTLSPQADTP